MRSRRLDASACSHSPTPQDPVNETALQCWSRDERFPQAFRRIRRRNSRRLSECPLRGTPRRCATRTEATTDAGLTTIGIAADQRGRHFPGGNRDGKIPRSDQAYDAHRLALRPHVDAVALRWQPRGRACAASLGGEISKDVDGAADFALGLPEASCLPRASSLRRADRTCDPVRPRRDRATRRAWEQAWRSTREERGQQRRRRRPYPCAVPDTNSPTRSEVSAGLRFSNVTPATHWPSM